MLCIFSDKGAAGFAQSPGRPPPTEHDVTTEVNFGDTTEKKRNASCYNNVLTTLYSIEWWYYIRMNPKLIEQKI